MNSVRMDRWSAERNLRPSLFDEIYARCAVGVILAGDVEGALDELDLVSTQYLGRTRFLVVEAGSW